MTDVEEKQPVENGQEAVKIDGNVTIEVVSEGDVAVTPLAVVEMHRLAAAPAVPAVARAAVIALFPVVNHLRTAMVRKIRQFL